MTDCFPCSSDSQRNPLPGVFTATRRRSTPSLLLRWLLSQRESRKSSSLSAHIFSMTLPTYRHDSNENNDAHSLSDITEEIHRTDRTVSNDSKQQPQQTQEEHSGINQHASRSPVRRALLTCVLVPRSIANVLKKLAWLLPLTVYASVWCSRAWTHPLSRLPWSQYRWIWAMLKMLLGPF